MNTLIILLNFCSFFLLLNTSKKAVLQHRFIEIATQKNSTIAKSIGLLLFVCTFYIAVRQYGFTAGILVNICEIMLIASLLILLNPLKKMNYKSVLLVFLLLLIIEFIIY